MSQRDISCISALQNRSNHSFFWARSQAILALTARKWRGTAPSYRARARHHSNPVAGGEGHRRKTCPPGRRAARLPRCAAAGGRAWPSRPRCGKPRGTVGAPQLLPAATGGRRDAAAGGKRALQDPCCHDRQVLLHSGSIKDGFIFPLNLI